MQHSQQKLTPPAAKVNTDGKLVLTGDWTVHSLPLAIKAVQDVGITLAKNGNRGNYNSLDLGGLGELDTSGVLLINEYRSRRSLPLANQDGDGADSRHFSTPLLNVSESVRALFNLCAMPAQKNIDPRQPEPKLLKIFVDTGRAMSSIPAASKEALNFLGLFVTAAAKTLLKPWTIRFTSLIYHMGQAGVGAVPIVALLSMLIGMVLAYMTSSLLADFGAEIFVVKLLEVGIFREMGVLITAILVAGRSGASFTAQVGAMVANQEVDAMRSMGIDPFQMLVIPRVFALMISLPILTLVANVTGLLGGMGAVWLSLDLRPTVFMNSLQQNISLTNFVLGFVKAPFFAVVIGCVGCLRGFQVTGSSESVGLLTTRAVVESIFLVIALDAAFALIFMSIGI